jgi:Domain of unknown function (DUF222)
MCSSLADAVTEVASVAVSGLPLGGLQELIAELARCRTRIDGVLSRAVGELHVRGDGLVADPAVAGAVCPTPAWLRTVVHVGPAAAGRQIRTAVALRELPAVAEAIVDGVLTVEHGRVLARLVGKIEPTALLSQPQLIEVARRTDPEALAEFVRHQIATWCEPELEADEAAAEQRRFLQLTNTHRGSWKGRFELPDAAMEIVRTVLEPLARRDGLGDDRSAGQRRADALTDVFGVVARCGDLPEAGGFRPTVTYVAPVAWASGEPTTVGQFALDLDRHPGEHCATGAWTGPATRAQLATLLCDARISRVVLDDAGQVVSLTSGSEQITAAQRRAVAARDRCCVAKGCTRPPAFCDVHHLRARADGGLSEIGNLVLLCRRHHVMWHRSQISFPDLRIPWHPIRARAPATS